MCILLLPCNKYSKKCYIWSLIDYLICYPFLFTLRFDWRIQLTFALTQDCKNDKLERGLCYSLPPIGEYWFLIIKRPANSSMSVDGCCYIDFWVSLISFFANLSNSNSVYLLQMKTINAYHYNFFTNTCFLGAFLSLHRVSLLLNLLISAYGDIIHFTGSLAVLTIG